jgi:phosphoglycerate dehydrogenase-like enzyme
VTVFVAGRGDVADGARAGLAERFPDVSVVAVPGPRPPPPEVTGDVLLAPFDLDRHLLVALAGRVGWVHVSSAGVDGFPLEQLPASVRVTCARGASAGPIAEYVMALILACEKRLPEVWIDAPPTRRFGPLGDQLWATDNELDGKVLGVLGLGAIGRRVSALGLAFGMEVVATRRRPELGGPPGVRVVPSAAQLWPVVDHLVLCAALTAGTSRLLDAAALSAMKPGAHVVNVGRGGLVDHAALARAVDSGRVGRASLDVVDPEPLPTGHPLYGHPNVRISPHVAGLGARATRRHLESFFENLSAYRQGLPLPGLVDRAAGY